MKVESGLCGLSFAFRCAIILEQEGAIVKLFGGSWEYGIIKNLVMLKYVHQQPHTIILPLPNFKLGTMQSGRCSFLLSIKLPNGDS